MEAKKDLNYDSYNLPVLSSDNLIDLLLAGKDINGAHITDNDDIALYKQFQHTVLKTPTLFPDDLDSGLTYDEFYTKRANEWLIPDSYKSLDVYEFLINKCKTETEVDRVNKEYIIYESRDLIMLLRLFIFLVDHFRQNKFMWGVGRGSSVSSYILYLIGIHRIDSIAYDLDIADFLK